MRASKDLDRFKPYGVGVGAIGERRTQLAVGDHDTPVEEGMNKPRRSGFVVVDLVGRLVFGTLL